MITVKRSGRDSLKSKRKPPENAACLWRERERDAVGEIEKDRINLGEAICCLNDVANVPQATDELNISLI